MLNSDLSEDPVELRREQLHNLDALLDELESLNLREIGALPPPLGERLRRAGVVFRDGAPASEIIDRVFLAQQPYLRSFPSTVNRRRPAA